MGCVQSMIYHLGCKCKKQQKSETKGASRADAYKLPERKPYSWEVSTRPDPKDFTFKSLKGERKIREPGTVNGQQFIIEECEDCDLYIFDQSAAVTVDDCTNCRIFLGPIESSVFLRNCKGCKCVITCRQFRTRDCTDCQVMLFCGTRPIIEASSNIQVGCADLNYSGLEAHLAAIHLSPWSNFWSHIYDFTPGDQPNWSILPPDVTSASLLGPLPCPPCSSDKSSAMPHPVTQGDRSPPEGSQGCFALFLPKNEARAAAFVTEASKQGLRLWRSNAATLASGTADNILACFGPDINAKAVATSLVAGRSIGLEFYGDDCKAKLVAVVAAQLEHLVEPGAILVTHNMDAAAQYRYQGLQG